MFGRFPEFSSGFTLFELILVLSICIIIGSVSFPMLTMAIKKRNIEAATWSVASNLEQARSRGLMGLAQPQATFTAGMANYVIGGQNSTIESGFICDNSVALTFDSLGRLLSPVNLEVRIKQSTANEFGTISIATQGHITWATTP